MVIHLGKKFNLNSRKLLTHKDKQFEFIFGFISLILISSQCNIMKKKLFEYTD